jgi:hypothetical protein
MRPVALPTTVARKTSATAARPGAQNDVAGDGKKPDGCDERHQHEQAAERAAAVVGVSAGALPEHCCLGIARRQPGEQGVDSHGGARRSHGSKNVRRSDGAFGSGDGERDETVALRHCCDRRARCRAAPRDTLPRAPTRA